MDNFDLGNVKLTVKWRGGFADRNDIFPISVDIQKESLDERVRTRIFNSFMNYFEKQPNAGGRVEIANAFLQEFYLTEVKYQDRFYTSFGGSGISIFKTAIKDTIYKDHWANVLTFIEFWAHVVDIMAYSSAYEEFIRKINEIFKIEFVGYRIIDGQITPITDEVEINAIEEVLRNPYTEVKSHISKALEKLSDRENPDYENSIKESISSVEAMARIITEEHKPTLGQALDQLEKKGVYMHAALKQAFKQLYGYTSDGSGIRHSGKLGGPNSTFEEAKFMLVACSAFNNYLIANKSN